jgi:hypothetical protein
MSRCLGQVKVHDNIAPPPLASGNTGAAANIASPCCNIHSRGTLRVVNPIWRLSRRQAHTMARELAVSPRTTTRLPGRESDTHSVALATVVPFGSRTSCANNRRRMKSVGADCLGLIRCIDGGLMLSGLYVKPRTDTYLPILEGPEVKLYLA